MASVENSYVGETKGPLNIRMNGHRDDWRHKRFERSLVGEHFCSSGHDFLSHASVCCLESNPEWTDNARKKTHLEYCCVVWGNSSNFNMYKTEKLQRRACKLILGNDYTTLENARKQLHI